MTKLIDLNDVHPKDIILADPEYPDQKERKVRPLLVISKSHFQQNSGYCVCVGLTSNKNNDPYAIPYGMEDVRIGRLNRDGNIMCKRFVTLRSDKVKEKIGTQIKDEIYQRVIAKIEDEIIETHP